jgi:hypothetical protein
MLFLTNLSFSLLCDPLAKTEPRLRCVESGVSYLSRPSVLASGLQHNLPFTHRRWFWAALQAAAATLLDDKHLDKTAETTAEIACATQFPDGTNPEKGGFDVGYQLVGTLLACRYIALSGSLSTVKTCSEMIRKSLVRHSEAIDSNGNISISDSTRIGRETNRVGRIKKISYSNAIETYIVSAKVLGNRSFHEIAFRLAERSE